VKYSVEEWHGSWVRQILSTESGIEAFMAARRYAVDNDVEVRVLSEDNRSAYTITGRGEMLPYDLTTKPVSDDYLAAMARDGEA
jgi:hypothetical protein